jgi:hypothetical protein
VVFRHGAGGFVAISIALIACASPHQPGRHRGDSSSASIAQPTVTPSSEGVAPPLNGDNALDPASTQVVIAGVLSWQDPQLSQFEAKHRKDRELHDLLRDERRVPSSQLALLLDRQATKAATLARLEHAARAAKASGTLVFYYAGHGVRDDDGTVYFANWDIETNKPAETGLSMAEIEAAIARGPKGLRVILMADCCYSGALRQVADGLSSRGMPTVSLTSADASNTSTQNWTFTQAAIDALRGDSLADRDASGTIELGELASEVHDAMKFREKQRAGFALRGVPEALVIARAAPGPKFGQDAGTFDVGAYGTVMLGSASATIRVRSVTANNRLSVRLYDYSDAKDVEVSERDVSAMAFARRPKDADLDVLWGGRTWEARVLETDGDFHLITYPGWPSVWNEWILSDRFAERDQPRPATKAPPASFAVGAKVEVEWGNKWWKAAVTRSEGGRYFVHYEGYDASYDEWVGPARLRPR